MPCQSCQHNHLSPVLSLGYLPPVNLLRPIEAVPGPETWLPANVVFCPVCELVQMECVGDRDTVFPQSYPYTSGSTRILRDNFRDLAVRAKEFVPLGADDLVVDIGSNDGTLLSNFDGYRRLGIEPTAIADVANARGIETWHTFFNRGVGENVRNVHGQARLVTACNVFAHIDEVHEVIEGILAMLAPDGVFVSESHYLFSLLQTAQYDTIYHEHLRYYSVNALRHLLASHGLTIVRVEQIPTHGGSIRVYAKRASKDEGVISMEPSGAALRVELARFGAEVMASKRRLMRKLLTLKDDGYRIVGVGAPSRAAVVINYCGIDNNILRYVAEIAGSRKIGRMMPGTMIPVVEEQQMLDDQPDYALVLSWHIGREIAASLRKKGYRGKFIHPILGEEYYPL